MSENENDGGEDVNDDFDKYATLCAVHTDWDRDCDVCVESANICRGMYEEQVRRVSVFEHQMMQEGAMLGGEMIVALKLEVLVSMMLGNKGRAYFDYLFNARLANEYENLLAQLRRAKILGGN